MGENTEDVMAHIKELKCPICDGSGEISIAPAGIPGVEITMVLCECCTGTGIADEEALDIT